MKKPKGDYSIQTVRNAVRVLEAFRDQEELGVTQISRRLGLHKNNVFRLLATLEELGYIAQCPDDTYKLGIKVLELGTCFGRNELIQRGRQHVAELAAASRETCHLGVLRNYQVVHVAGEQTPRAIAASLRVGSRLPAYCTALGKILLGCAPEELRRGFYAARRSGGGLDRRTPATIVDLDKLFEHLGSVAVAGVAVDFEECEEGLFCAAAPVFDATGRVVAAVSVSGPGTRWDEPRVHAELVPMVHEAGERLSKVLGYDA